MAEAREKLARTILRNNLGAKKGDSVVIESWAHTLPYAAAFVEEARRIGAQPTLLYEDEDAWWAAVKSKQFRPFAKLSKAERAAVRDADVYIYFWGPGDFPKAADLPPKVGAKVTAWNDEWYATARKGGLRGVRMSLGFLGDPTAEKFGFKGPDLREQVAEAGATDAKSMQRRGDKVLAKLRKGKELHVVHENGTDVRVSLKGIKGRVDSGLVTAEARKARRGMLTNNPTGLVMVAVNGSDATGTVVGNRAVYDMGAFVRSDGANWTLESGRLTAHEMGDGAAQFDKGLKDGKKGADQFGYFSIGLNPAYKAIPPAEDTEEGAILLSVGNNQLVDGGTNKSNFRGFAMVGDATIEVDGTPIARGGRIL